MHLDPESKKGVIGWCVKSCVVEAICETGSVEGQAIDMGSASHNY
jgi:hypothetical protein